MEDKNYYEWLEISKNASPEVVEKAYKALVKKYHPDLQEGENKIQAEEMIKKINQAYEVLSDETKRKQYDETIKDDNISKADYEKLKEELEQAKKEASVNNNYNNTNYNNINNYRNVSNNVENNVVNNQYAEQMRRQQQELQYQQQLQQARQKAYHDAYIQDLKNRGYKIRYKKTYKQYLRSLIIIAITLSLLIILGIILWIIPFTKNGLISLYNNNQSIKFFADVVSNFIKALFNIK